MQFELGITYNNYFYLLLNVDLASSPMQGLQPGARVYVWCSRDLLGHKVGRTARMRSRNAELAYIPTASVQFASRRYNYTCARNGEFVGIITAPEYYRNCVGIDRYETRL